MICRKIGRPIVEADLMTQIGWMFALDDTEAKLPDDLTAFRPERPLCDVEASIAWSHSRRRSPGPRNPAVPSLQLSARSRNSGASLATTSTMRSRPLLFASYRAWSALRRSEAQVSPRIVQANPREQVTRTTLPSALNAVPRQAAC